MLVRPAPIEQPMNKPDGLLYDVWKDWFRDIGEILKLISLDNVTITINPTNPYTVVADNEIIFITTSSLFVVNLKPVLDGLRCRVINMPASTANVELTPDGSDLLYGVNAAETIYPDEARDVDGSASNGYY